MDHGSGTDEQFILEREDGLDLKAHRHFTFEHGLRAVGDIKYIWDKRVN